MTPEQRKRLEDIVYSHVITSKLDSDVRAALAEIDRLHKHNLDLQRSYDDACSDAAAYEDEAVRLRAEIDRLTKLLKDCEEQMAPPEVNGI